jgi:hypothetical protein
MFIRAWKRKKVADAVLSQVQPLLVTIARILGGVPPGLTRDKYMLGFFCMTIGIAMQQMAHRPLNTEDKGTILLVVLRHLFGPGAINEREIGDLLNGVPTSNDEFKQGTAAAYKVQAVSSGSHSLQNDPDYLAAREVVRCAGGSLDALSPGASDDSKIAGEMLRLLYYQRVMDLYQKT